MLDGQNLGPELLSAPNLNSYGFAWDTTTVPGGPHTLTASMRDGAGNFLTSAPAAITIDNSANSPPASGTFARLLGVDALTGGDWKGFYGQDAVYIPQYLNQVPAYSAFQLLNPVNSILRDLYSYDTRALAKLFPSYIPYERVKADFSSTTSLQFLVTTGDNQAHRLALYFCDWDKVGKSVLVEAVDSQTGITLAQTTLSSSFYNAPGTYVVFRYRGPILLRITNLTGSADPSLAATVSGFFWGGGGPY
jgi:hypothetical protein